LRLYNDAAQAVFQIAATGGLPTYSYVWRLNGEPLDAAQQPHGPELTLAAPLAGKTGSYECTVTDSAVPANTATSGSAVLAVCPHLDILQHPQGGPQLVGASVTLSVAATGGIPDLQYAWRRDGTPLPPEKQPHGPVLDLSNLTVTDAGGYDVVIYDEGGESATSETATITVTRPIPLEITEQPSGAAIKEGQSHTFTVSTSGGTGAVHYQWWFLPKGEGTQMKLDNDAPSLTVSNATVDKTGSYDCTVTDSGAPANTVTSDTAALAVYPHLDILQHPQGGPQVVGASVTLSVAVTGGIPDLQYAWRRDGTPLPPEKQPHGPVLDLSNLTVTDAGGYDVVISDGGGESATSETATITVSRPVLLEITGQPSGAAIKEGQSHTFTVSISGGTGTVHYQWWFLPKGETKQLKLDGDASSLTVSNATVDKSGNYWVELSDATDTPISNRAELIVTEVGLPVGTPWSLIAWTVLLAAAGAWRTSRNPQSTVKRATETIKP
jgi:hypothetical protein